MTRLPLCRTFVVVAVLQGLFVACGCPPIQSAHFPDLAVESIRSLVVLVPEGHREITFEGFGAHDQATLDFEATVDNHFRLAFTPLGTQVAQRRDVGLVLDDEKEASELFLDPERRKRWLEENESQAVAIVERTSVSAEITPYMKGWIKLSNKPILQYEVGFSMSVRVYYLDRPTQLLQCTGRFQEADTSLSDLQEDLEIFVDCLAKQTARTLAEATGQPTPEFD